jgi:hypothetical protein
MSQTLPRGLLDATPVIFEELDCRFARRRVGDHATRKPSNAVRYLKRNRMCPMRDQIGGRALNLSTHKAPQFSMYAKTGLFGSEYQ